MISLGERSSCLSHGFSFEFPRWRATALSRKEHWGALLYNWGSCRVRGRQATGVIAPDFECGPNRDRRGVTDGTGSPVTSYARVRLPPRFHPARPSVMLGDGTMRSKRKQALRMVHPHCAGIDVGKAAHYVAVPECADERPVSLLHQLHRRVARDGRSGSRASSPGSTPQPDSPSWPRRSNLLLHRGGDGEGACASQGASAHHRDTTRLYSLRSVSGGATRASMRADTPPLALKDTPHPDPRPSAAQIRPQRHLVSYAG